MLSAFAYVLLPALAMLIVIAVAEDCRHWDQSGM